MSRKKGTPTVTKILDIHGIDWGICGSNTLAAATYIAVTYTKKGLYTPTQFMFFSGHAFRVSTNRSVAPMVGYDSLGLTEKAMRNLGFDTKVVIGGLHGSEWSPDKTEAALELIRDSIGRGIPAIGFNLDNYEYGLIYGYDDSGRMLHISDVSSSKGKAIRYDELGQRSRFGEPIAPELFVMSLIDRDELPHLHVNRTDPEQDRSYRSSMRNALNLINEHLYSDQCDERGCRCGLAAIDEWIAAFEEGTAHSFFTSYNLELITSACRFAPAFFTESCHPKFFAIQHYGLQSLMADAAVCYTEVYREWVRLSQLYPFPKSADTKDKQRAEQSIRHLQRIQELESDGAELLQKMMDVLGRTNWKEEVAAAHE